MPKRYMLEIDYAGTSTPPTTFNSDQTFASFARGDKISVIGNGGKLATFSVASVEYTIWMDGRAPVQKTRILVS